MVRRIGFGNQGGSRLSPRRLIMMLVVLAIMDAIAFALVIRSVLAENWPGVIAGLAFSAIASGLMVMAILRRVRGDQRGPDHNRKWADSGEHGD